MKKILQKWGLPALTLFTFFFLLGSRPLNEPDEGRYAEIAREMIETGNWLVPHLWYLPHLDKPPMTYWLVAVSMKMFGQNEWAVRLPVALAGVSGIFAAFLFGKSLGGRRVGFWSALILQSSLLYFVMARLLTPDIFLTQFVAWAMYFFWRSWQIQKAEGRRQKAEFFLWHSLGWIFVALGFLTKGPIALAIPAVAFAALSIFHRREISSGKILAGGIFVGLVLFLILAAPWFLAIFQRVPESANYMIVGQAAGHLLGTTIKNRPGGPFYFFGILAVGLLPWTILLGWLYKSPKFKVQSPELEIQSAIGNRQSAISRGGWLLLNVWVIFTFVLFSLSQAKLPAYILPIFPALAVLLAWKFFGGEQTNSTVPRLIWQICLIAALLPPMIFPPLLKFAFHDEIPDWMKWQTSIITVILILILLLSWKWPMPAGAGFIVTLALLGFFVIAAELPQFETSLRGNQTLKPLALALRANVRPGDVIVCWGKFPEGLPFYSGGAISETNRPYLGGMDLTQVPFEFPGNRERLGHLLLPDDEALAQLLQEKRVWLVGFGKTVEKFQKNHSAPELRLVAQIGQWELFTNR